MNTKTYIKQVVSLAKLGSFYHKNADILRQHMVSLGGSNDQGVVRLVGRKGTLCCSYDGYVSFKRKGVAVVNPYAALLAAVVEVA